METWIYLVSSRINEPNTRAGAKKKARNPIDLRSVRNEMNKLPVSV
jgi:hypothetical protein